MRKFIIIINIIFSMVILIKSLSFSNYIDPEILKHEKKLYQKRTGGTLEGKAEYYCGSLGDTPESEQVLKDCLADLKKAGKPVVKILMKIAKEHYDGKYCVWKGHKIYEHHGWRERAIFVLGHIGDIEAVDFIIGYFENDREVCCAAARSLGMIGGEKAKKALIKFVEKRMQYDKYLIEDDDVIKALANIGDEDILPLLENIFKKHKHEFMKKETEKAIKILKKKIKEKKEKNATQKTNQ